MANRNDGRNDDQLRPLRFVRDFQRGPMGSVLAEFGNTRVICAVSITDGVPRWMREQNVPGGWLTAEYQMLPGSTGERSARETRRGGPSGRSSEIQRLIGRSLRMAVDLTKLGQRTVTVDCDVLDADGGTRCASICGGMAALESALRKLHVLGKLDSWPIRSRVAAVSVGMVANTPLLDLCYEEDSAAEVDMNVVMNEDLQFIEIQGTAESRPLAKSGVDALLDLASGGIRRIFAHQAESRSPS